MQDAAIPLLFTPSGFATDEAAQQTEEQITVDK
jgi:hypothetical protein